MHKHYKLIALAAVVALVTLFLLHRSETDRILGQLEDLRALAEIQAPEGSVELLVKSRLLGAFFTENTVYDLTGTGHGLYEISSRQELVQRIARIRAKLAGLELALEDMQVSVEGDTASVLLRGTGLGTMRGEDDQFLEIHSIEIRLQKVEDTWLITGGRQIRNERDQTQ
ncbi:MAG: nuclear transport factor 2 family protein [Gammaproteobacteria bacterium]|jgi:hypothetical protein